MFISFWLQMEDFDYLPFLASLTRISLWYHFFSLSFFHSSVRFFSCVDIPIQKLLRNNSVKFCFCFVSNLLLFQTINFEMREWVNTPISLLSEIITASFRKAPRLRLISMWISFYFFYFTFFVVFCLIFCFKLFCF